MNLNIRTIFLDSESKLPVFDVDNSNRCAFPLITAITVMDVRNAKAVRTGDKSQGLDGLCYEPYYNKTNLFRGVLAVVYCNQQQHGSVSSFVSRGAATLFKKVPNKWYIRDNFSFVTVQRIIENIGQEVI